MQVTIPTTLPCDPAHCVLQWVWIATHISIMRPEYYDDCVDLKITGAHQVTVTAESPTGQQSREDQAPGASLLLPAPPVAGPPPPAPGGDAGRAPVLHSPSRGGGGEAPGPPAPE